MIEGIRIVVRGDHPAMVDHFPGNPIVPGALLLDEALSAGQRAGLPAIRRFVAVKFLAFLLPDTVAIVDFRSRDDGKIRLRCRTEPDGTTILTALLECENEIGSRLSGFGRP